MPMFCAASQKDKGGVVCFSTLAWQEKVDQGKLLPMLGSMYREHLIKQVGTDLEGSILVEGGAFCNKGKVGACRKYEDTISGAQHEVVSTHGLSPLKVSDHSPSKFRSSTE